MADDAQVEAKPEAQPAAGSGGATEPPKVEAPAAELAKEPEKKSGAPAPDWRDERMAKLTARLAEARATLAQTEARLNAATKAPDEAIQTQIDQRAEQLADQKTAMRLFQERCRETRKEGEASFGKEFDERLNTILQVAGRDPASRQWIDAESADRYDSFLVAVLETGEAAKVLHEIGKSQEDVSRILNMPLTRQVAELTKIAVRLGQPEPGPSLPKPIAPVNTAGNSSAGKLDPSNPEHAGEMSREQWFAARQAQVDARHGGDQRRLAGGR